MKKYIAIAKTFFKAQFVYRFDVLMTAVGTVWRVVFAVVLWGAVFEKQSVVGGLTLPMMLSYYVVTSFFAATDLSAGVGLEVSGSITGGKFSKFMVIPGKPQIRFLAQTFGKSAFYALFTLPAAAVATFVFGIDLVFGGRPGGIATAIAMYLLGIVFMNAYQFFLGLWAFKFTEVGFILYLVPAAVSFLKGEMVPLSLLPDAVRGVIAFIPFTHTVYTPVMLLTGGAEVSEGLFGISVLAGWTLFALAANELTYRHLRTKYEGVGI